MLVDLFPLCLSKGQALSHGFCQIRGKWLVRLKQTYPIMRKCDCGSYCSQVYNRCALPFHQAEHKLSLLTRDLLKRRLDARVKWETSSIEQMQEVLEKDDVGSFVQLRSCCVHTRFVRVRDGLYLVRQF